MPFITPTVKLAPERRVLISGPPNTFKTTGLLQWPQPVHILSYPGEKGWTTIPLDTPGITAHVWEVDDPAKVSASAVVAEIETRTYEVLSGKHGPIETFAGDGLHKLYGWYYQRARAQKRLSAAYAGAEKAGKDPEEAITGPAYGQAHEDFSLYLTRVLSAKVPYIVMTVWEGKSKDDPEDLRRAAPSHIFPDLPGEMAKRVVGEFPVVLYAEVSLPDLKGNISGTWQIKPGGKVWGVGAKLDPALAKTLPGKIPQSFEALQKVLKGESLK